MNIISTVRGLFSPSEPDTAAAIAAAVRPAGLPAFLATLEAAQRHRSLLSQHHDMTPTGPDSLRPRLRQDAELVDRVINRHMISDRIEAALVQRQADRTHQAQAIASAEKTLAAREADVAAARKRRDDVAARLTLLQQSERALAAERGQRVQEAEQALSAAVLAGDLATEETAARVIAGGDAEDAELRSVRVRLAEVTKLHATVAAAHSDAEEALRAARHALHGAQLELAGLELDEALDAPLLAMLRVVRAGNVAQAAGANDIAERALAALSGVEFVAVDYKRAWLPAKGVHTRGGALQLPFQTLRQIAAALDEPAVDAAALMSPRDLQKLLPQHDRAA